MLTITFAQVTDAGCAALAVALDSGALPALETLDLYGIPASTAAIDAVSETLTKSRAAAPPLTSDLPFLITDCGSRLCAGHPRSDIYYE